MTPAHSDYGLLRVASDFFLRTIFSPLKITVCALLSFRFLSLTFRLHSNVQSVVSHVFFFRDVSHNSAQKNFSEENNFFEEKQL